ncbi:MAG: transcriptional regulator [Ruminococcus sp.]|nr:transcriptional regulator [Ruminococcus sp.]
MTKIPVLFKIMKEKGITQKQLAASIGASQGNVADWKSGRGSPSIDKLPLIADCLNVSIDYLLGRAEMSKPADDMFWINFNSLCEQNGKTPNSVCKDLGFSNATATHWKNGTPPGSKSLAKIAEYFNVSTDYLLGKAANARSVIDKLSEKEKSLLTIFRQLTDAQQDLIIDKASLLVESNEAEAKKKA